MRFSASNLEFSTSFSSFVCSANSSRKAIILLPLPQSSDIFPIQIDPNT
ncbi:hypothetical protein X992_5601 [Burkholderia pseudomallei MSHR5492]|nr:hypothetical protein X992_5601 [Burkholderia pseudomallei MSHR5492]